jgi:serine/threonine-protein kinase
VPRPTSTITQELEVRLANAIGGRYRIERLLGRGGMGAVFLAHDLTLDRPVAIKVLPPEVAHDENLVKRFEHEARIAARLDHPGIMPIYSVESSAGLHFFVMKYVDGRSLEDLLIERPRLDVEECQQILWEAARALGHAHRRGVIHRDIKPANLVLEHDGRPVLTDFGISKALQSASEFTGTGQILGTPHYMSPEQARGFDVDGRSDQYGLAVLGYRMLAGRLPFEDDSLHTVIFKHVFESARRLDAYRADTPPFLVEAIHRALSKSPGDRFPTMEGFATAVWPEHPISAPVGAARPSAERRVPTPDTEAPTEITDQAGLHATRSPTRHRRAWAAVAVAVVIVAAGATAAWALLARGGIGGPAIVPPGDFRSGVVEPAGVDSLVTTGAGAESTAAPIEATEAAPRPAPERRGEPAPTVGYLTVAAEPWGVLFVDRRRVGDTPVYGLALSPGAHEIRIQRDGHQGWVDTIVVVAGDTARRSVRLVRENL